MSVMNQSGFHASCQPRVLSLLPLLMFFAWVKKKLTPHSHCLISCLPPPRWTLPKTKSSNGHRDPHPKRKGKDTPRKINMEPENTPLEKLNHLPNHHFWVQVVNLRGLYPQTSHFFQGFLLLVFEGCIYYRVPKAGGSRGGVMLGNLKVC